MNFEEIRTTLDSRFAARERAIALSREVIRSSANAIRALHRSEWELAGSLVAGAAERLGALADVVAGHGDLTHSALVADAAKEYAEARLTQALLTGAPLPTPADVGVDPVPYLHGLGETVGEVRRRMLDLLRSEDFPEANRLLDVMDQIVDYLATMDYPDGMTNGLRRTTDVARSLVE
ncbi:MAG: haloacid dehalogenase, partial [Actinobacteria bacterium]|nr:haloacid dehalogenase [Actinomycetota bacterium]